MFNPCSSEEFTLPMVDYNRYQIQMIPILNNFIRMVEDDDNNNLGLFVNYSPSRYSEGNRFVLNSLIDIALKKDAWIIVDEVNLGNILHILGKSLSS